MKLFLDDYRNPTNTMKDFNVVRSYEACVQLLLIFKDDIEMIDLDYDLGGGETGLDVLKYMDKERVIPKHINIHSDHKDGVPAMMKFAEEHFPEAVVTTNKI